MQLIVEDDAEVLRRIARTPAWTAVTDPREAASFLAELQRELPSAHVLSGIQVKPIARRHDRDDLLLAVTGAREPLAVVHLTYAPAASNTEAFPWTRFYASWEEWERDEQE